MAFPPFPTKFEVRAGTMSDDEKAPAAAAASGVNGLEAMLAAINQMAVKAPHSRAQNWRLALHVNAHIASRQLGAPPSMQSLRDHGACRRRPRCHLAGGRHPA